MTTTTTSILATLIAWLSATPTLGSSSGGDEASWNASCEATHQPVLPTMSGPRRRQADPVVEAKRVEEAALETLLAIADGVAWYTKQTARAVEAYNIRPIGPEITLRRHMARGGEPVVLSTAEVVRVAAAIRAARASATVGYHLGTRGGLARDLRMAAGAA